jgi:excisionase family DNA binding protein
MRLSLAAWLGASLTGPPHPQSDLLNQMRGDDWTSCCLIFPAGISRGREVVGQGGKNRSNWLPLWVCAKSTKRRDHGSGEEVVMSAQPNLIIQSERSRSLREAPVSQQYAARFLNMHPKTVLRKAREGSLPAHPVGSDRKRWHFYLSELDDWLRSQVIAGHRAPHNMAASAVSEE